jgi:hypothetical protein
VGTGLRWPFLLWTTKMLQHSHLGAVGGAKRVAALKITNGTAAGYANAHTVSHIHHPFIRFR